MVLGFLSSVYYFLLYGLFDLLLYVLVDVVAKNSLRSARDEVEKRLIWLYEALMLFLIALPVYFLHHTPYVLVLLTILTFLYTQLQGRIDFRYWWRQLVTRWEEFQQHEESMEQLQEMQTRQARNPVPIPPFQIPISVPGVGWLPPPSTGFMPPPHMVPQPFAPMNFNLQRIEGVPGSTDQWFPQNPERTPMVMSQRMPMPNNVSVSQMRYRNSGSSSSSGAPPMSQLPPSPPMYTHTRSQPVFSMSPTQPMYNTGIPCVSQLTRRPLHSHLASPQKSRSSAHDITRRIKTSFLSAFGYTLPKNPLLGLENSGQNLCFLNSVLQCLTHSPSLVDSLAYDVRLAKDSGTPLTFIETLSELMGQLIVTAGEEKFSALDTEALRCVATGLIRGSSLIVDPKIGGQSQQDAAEFLMWLLDTLHTQLNTKRPLTHMSTTLPGQGPPVVERHPFCPKFTAMTLNMLKFIYGDLDQNRVDELKVSCRAEIEGANGLNSDSYAEPIQRLSDLEWLTYKERNNSAVDDLFTGQLVEAQHCIACNRISVGIQTFNVLPVPIVEPRQLNGLVYLEDCFAKFGNIEDLYGSEGLRCETCNAVALTSLVSGTRSTDHFLHNPRLHHLQEAASLTASPVLRNGGATGRVPMARTGGGITSSSSTDSATHSTLSGQTMVMSPIPNTDPGINDSGFQDHVFRTSTPIHAASATSAAAPVRFTDGQRRSLLRQLPECLIVQLMRFSYHQGHPRKIHRPVIIPLANLDLTHLIIDNVMKREDLTAFNACYRYNLYGLCIHLGSESTGCGHYVSYAQASDGHWYKFDDENVKQVNMEYEVNTREVRENAYLLCFRKSALV